MTGKVVDGDRSDDLNAGPNPGTPDAACDPCGRQTRKRGLQYNPLCDAKQRTLGALAEKTLGKAPGGGPHPPARPRPAIRRSLRCETGACASTPQLRPRNRRVDAAAQACSPSRHDTLVTPPCPRTGGCAEPPAPGAPAFVECDCARDRVLALRRGGQIVHSCAWRAFAASNVRPFVVSRGQIHDVLERNIRRVRAVPRTNAWKRTRRVQCPPARDSAHQYARERAVILNGRLRVHHSPSPPAISGACLHRQARVRNARVLLAQHHARPPRLVVLVTR